eukprot:scaffold170325_cov27-Tisochrysis_lutea.AAC.2
MQGGERRGTTRASRGASRHVPHGARPALGDWRGALPPPSECSGAPTDEVRRRVSASVALRRSSTLRACHRCHPSSALCLTRRNLKPALATLGHDPYLAARPVLALLRRPPR